MHEALRLVSSRIHSTQHTPHTHTHTHTGISVNECVETLSVISTGGGATGIWKAEACNAAKIPTLPPIGQTA